MPSRYLITLSVAVLALLSFAQLSQGPVPTSSKTANENQQTPASNAHGTQKQHSTPQPSVSDASTPKVSVPSNGHKADTHHDPATNWITWFTLALVVCAFLQYLAMKKQAGYMRRGLRINLRAVRLARRSATAAKRGAEAAFQNAQAVINSERAWLLPVMTKHQGIGSTYTFALKFVNYGRTPAHLISVQHFEQVFPRGKELQLVPDYGPETEFESVILLAPNGYHELGDEIDLAEYSQWTRHPKVDTGDEVVWVYGVARYRDVLPGSEIHQTRFCYRYFRRLRDWRIAGPREYSTYT